MTEIKDFATDQLEEKKYFEYTSHWYFLTVFEGHPLWDDLADPDKIKARCPELTYGVWQLEEGDKEHHAHYQCTFKFERGTRWSTAREYFKPAHCQRVISVPGATKYCQKEKGRLAGPFTFGVADKRTISAKMVHDDIVRKRPLVEAVEDLSLQGVIMYKKARVIVRSAMKLPKEKPVIHVVYGPPRVGKNCWLTARLNQFGIRDETDHNCHVMDDAKWWDGYEFEEHVVFDECDKTDDDSMGRSKPLSNRAILRLLEGSFKGQVKGSMLDIRPKHVWFVGNRPIWECYEGDVRKSIIQRILENGEALHIKEKHAWSLPDGSPKTGAKDVASPCYDASYDEI